MLFGSVEPDSSTCRKSPVPGEFSALQRVYPHFERPTGYSYQVPDLLQSENLSPFFGATITAYSRPSQPAVYYTPRLCYPSPPTFWPPCSHPVRIQPLAPSQSVNLLPAFPLMPKFPIPGTGQPAPATIVQPTWIVDQTSRTVFLSTPLVADQLSPNNPLTCLRAPPHQHTWAASQSPQNLNPSTPWIRFPSVHQQQYSYFQGSLAPTATVCNVLQNQGTVFPTLLSIMPNETLSIAPASSFPDQSLVCQLANREPLNSMTMPCEAVTMDPTAAQRSRLPSTICLPVTPSAVPFGFSSSTHSGQRSEYQKTSGVYPDGSALVQTSFNPNLNPPSTTTCISLSTNVISTWSASPKPPIGTVHHFSMRPAARSVDGHREINLLGEEIVPELQTSNVVLDSDQLNAPEGTISRRKQNRPHRIPHEPTLEKLASSTSTPRSGPLPHPLSLPPVPGGQDSGCDEDKNVHYKCSCCPFTASRYDRVYRHIQRRHKPGKRPTIGDDAYPANHSNSSDSLGESSRSLLSPVTLPSSSIDLLPSSSLSSASDLCLPSSTTRTCFGGGQSMLRSLVSTNSTVAETQISSNSREQIIPRDSTFTLQPPTAAAVQCMTSPVIPAISCSVGSFAVLASSNPRQKLSTVVLPHSGHSADGHESIFSSSCPNPSFLVTPTQNEPHSTSEKPLPQIVAPSPISRCLEQNLGVSACRASIAANHTANFETALFPVSSALTKLLLASPTDTSCSQLATSSAVGSTQTEVSSVVQPTEDMPCMMSAMVDLVVSPASTRKWSTRPTSVQSVISNPISEVYSLPQDSNQLVLSSHSVLSTCSTVHSGAYNQIGIASASEAHEPSTVACMVPSTESLSIPVRPTSVPITNPPPLSPNLARCSNSKSVSETHSPLHVIESNETGRPDSASSEVEITGCFIPSHGEIDATTRSEAVATNTANNSASTCNQINEDNGANEMPIMESISPPPIVSKLKCSIRKTSQPVLPSADKEQLILVRGLQVLAAIDALRKKPDREETDAAGSCVVPDMLSNQAVSVTDDAEVYPSPPTSGCPADVLVSSSSECPQMFPVVSDVLSQSLPSVIITPLKNRDVTGRAYENSFPPHDVTIVSDEEENIEETDTNSDLSPEKLPICTVDNLLPKSPKDLLASDRSMLSLMLANPLKSNLGNHACNPVVCLSRCGVTASPVPQATVPLGNRGTTSSSILSWFSACSSATPTKQTQRSAISSVDISSSSRGIRIQSAESISSSNLGTKTSGLPIFVQNILTGVPHRPVDDTSLEELFEQTSDDYIISRSFANCQSASKSQASGTNSRSANAPSLTANLPDPTSSASALASFRPHESAVFLPSSDFPRQPRKRARLSTSGGGNYSGVYNRLPRENTDNFSNCSEMSSSSSVAAADDDDDLVFVSCGSERRHSLRRLDYCEICAKNGTALCAHRHSTDPTGTKKKVRQRKSKRPRSRSRSVETKEDTTSAPSTPSSIVTISSSATIADPNSAKQNADIYDIAEEETIQEAPVTHLADLQNNGPFVVLSPGPVQPLSPEKGSDSDIQLTEKPTFAVPAVKHHRRKSPLRPLRNDPLIFSEEYRPENRIMVDVATGEVFVDGQSLRDLVPSLKATKNRPLNRSRKRNARLFHRVGNQSAPRARKRTTRGVIAPGKYKAAPSLPLGRTTGGSAIESSTLSKSRSCNGRFSHTHENHNVLNSSALVTRTSSLTISTDKAVYKSANNGGRTETRPPIPVLRIKIRSENQIHA
ncbi:unnamed protein product [Calicophoron daubneyi]|uniref:Uncharacterized protein n=1 Tax=Calicophoron daubneyi TaxID=300641 RepID=A0AAV2TQE7_CALDB